MIVVNTRKTLGLYGSSYVRTPNDQVVTINSDLIGTSLDSEYVPYFSIFRADFFRVGNLKYHVYGVNMAEAIGACSNTRHLQYLLTNSVQLQQFTRYAEVTYYVMKGFIGWMNPETHKFETLFCLVVKDDYWRTTNPNEGNIDYTEFKLLIYEGINVPANKSMLAYLRKSIFKYYLEAGIDIVWTRYITRYIFKPCTLPVNFRTIAHKNEYLQNLSQSAINEFLGPEPAPEPIPERPTSQIEAPTVYAESTLSATIDSLRTTGTWTIQVPAPPEGGWINTSANQPL